MNSRLYDLDKQLSHSSRLQALNFLYQNKGDSAAVRISGVSTTMEDLTVKRPAHILQKPCIIVKVEGHSMTFHALPLFYLHS